MLHSAATHLLPFNFLPQLILIILHKFGQCTKFMLRVLMNILFYSYMEEIKDVTFPEGTTKNEIFTRIMSHNLTEEFTWLL